MKKTTLKQVSKLASQLSPEERQQLFLFLAQLPDSKVRVSVEEPLRRVLSPAEKKKFDAAAKTDEMYVLSDGKTAAVFQRGRLIFQVLFYASNFLSSRMEIQSWKDSPDTEFMTSEVRRALDLMDRTDVTQEELDDKIRKEMHSQFEKHSKEIAGDISRMLPTFARIFSEGVIVIADFGSRNRLAAQRGFPKHTLEDAVKILGPELKQIKQMLNVKPGGRINVRHHWTKTDYLCLQKHHDRLWPIWKEAKRVAKEARNSKERTRQKRWKEQVSAIYADENLPDDLIAHLSAPDEWPPSDLALVHAGRLCVPDVSPPYSLKVLREKLKLAKREKDPHPKSSKKGSAH